MTRKEFLKISGAMLPMPFLGIPYANAKEKDKTMKVPTYFESENYLVHASALRFNDNGMFKIVQFTDVHWKPNHQGSKIAEERMNEVLDAEKPDFVIFTGDIFTGSPMVNAIKEALTPVVDRNLKFAVTLGNHDDEQDMTRQQIYEQIKDIPGNLTGTVEGISGVTNFILPIISSKNEKEAFILYMFDSLAYSREEETKGYDWIKADQIAWYQQCSQQLTEKNNGQPFPALAFFHIPLPEYNIAAADENAAMIGVRKEKACAPSVNSGLFSAMLERKDVMAIFVGHDHVNDYIVKRQGIFLGYGRFTGGPTTYFDPVIGNGARVFELTEGKRTFKTWIRLKEGKIVSELNCPDDFARSKF